jgi:hypothetical protein
MALFFDLVRGPDDDDGEKRRLKRLHERLWVILLLVVVMTVCCGADCSTERELASCCGGELGTPMASRVLAGVASARRWSGLYW